MNYRADIDGLRALAVLPVIFYHLGIDVFASGYVGVDIFFAISGYLITGIIYKDMQFERDENNNPTFSIVRFYERRVRRILPVFLCVVATALTLAYFFFITQALQDVAKSALYAIGISGNYFFWADNDYFSLEAHFKPLLHTWSLAVEEQFYVFFPFFLYFCVKHNKPVLRYIYVITAVSFIACLIMTHFSSRTAFYWLPFRAWELLLGSIVAIKSLPTKTAVPLIQFSSRKKERATSLATLLLLAFSVTFMEYITIGFPSYIAFIPCFAALMCIEIGKDKDSLIYAVLSNRILVIIGKLSYSLYLWHWIVIVCLLNITLQQSTELSLTQQFLCLVASFGLSILSYNFLEQPIRRKSVLQSRTTVFVTMASLCVLLFGISYALMENKIKRPFVNKYLHINPVSPTTYVGNIPGLVSFGDASIPPTLMVIGDSFSVTIHHVLDHLAREHAVSGLLYTSPKCPLANTLDDDNANLKISTPQSIIEHQKYLKKYVEDKDIQGVLFYLRWPIRTYGKYLGTERSDNHRLFYVNKDGSLNKDSMFAMQQGLRDTMDFFNNKDNVKVFYLKNSPEFLENVPTTALRVDRQNIFKGKHGKLDLYTSVTIPYADIKELHKDVYEILPFASMGMQGIDIAQALCDTEFCYGLTKAGDILYVDSNHLSNEGAFAIKDLLLPFILSGTKK